MALLPFSVKACFLLSLGSVAIGDVRLRHTARAVAAHTQRSVKAIVADKAIRFHNLDLPEATLRDVVPNDFWAIHDLIAIGHSAVFMKHGSQGQQEVRDRAQELVGLLQYLHPYAPCRDAVASALEDATSEELRHVAVANAVWACLPGNFSADSFDTAFAYTKFEDDNHLRSMALDARMPHPKDPAALGTCRGSSWPRSCSLWVSLHAMAYRADAMQMSKRFLDVVFAVVAGGVTLCGGCTKHFITLHDFALSPALLRDQGSTF
mmetsp:Transcript_65751/g.140657  ORF Transcript_65751/g.140657 Transcript_65751/m.140657 type:complete len:264 (-) Transcript_65751:601-1392(-)